MFTTEGHVISVDEQLRESPWKELFAEGGGHGAEGKAGHRSKAPEFRGINSSSNVSAPRPAIHLECLRSWLPW